MISLHWKKAHSKKIALGVSAAALAFGAGAPAMAGSYVSVGYASPVYYHSGYHYAGYSHHGYRGGHHYRGRHGHHHGHGGGKGAAIALGVIGGAIILNELAEDRARDRYYEDRYYEQRARERAYQRGYYEGRADEQRYDEDYQDGAYYDEGDYEDAADIGQRLDGGPAPIRVSADAAYQACLRHARQALSERGYVVSAPYRPETVEDRGGALLLTATVTTQRGADMWSRAMSCEASESRVYRMELI